MQGVKQTAGNSQSLANILIFCSSLISAFILIFWNHAWKYYLSWDCLATQSFTSNLPINYISRFSIGCFGYFLLCARPRLLTTSFTLSVLSLFTSLSLCYLSRLERPKCFSETYCFPGAPWRMACGPLLLWRLPDPIRMPVIAPPFHCSLSSGHSQSGRRQEPAVSIKALSLPSLPFCHHPCMYL